MTTNSVEVLDTTVHKTHEWLRDIAKDLGTNNQRYAYLALRGTLHAVRDFLPLDESAHLSAQLPMLVRGIYFEGWDPTGTPERDGSRDRFLGRVENAMERALWNEDLHIEAEQAARAVLRVLADRVSEGEIAQVQRVMPEPIRDLWPTMSATR
jgi:uncharacterized protein (DUF2267 family)